MPTPVTFVTVKQVVYQVTGLATASQFPCQVVTWRVFFGGGGQKLQQHIFKQTNRGNILFY